MRKKEEKGRIVPGVLATMALVLAFCVVTLTAQAEETNAMAQQAAPPSLFKGFFENAKVGMLFRTSYFYRTSNGDDSNAGVLDQRATGIGGTLYGSTGEIRDLLSFGAAYDFTIPLYAPDGEGYNYILRDPNQNPVSSIGEAYSKLRFGKEAVVVVGRQTINNAWYMEDVARFYNKLDQSMIGKRDVRAMQWIKYEAATIQGSLDQDTYRYYGGYITGARQINDNEFRNPYKAAFQTAVWPDDAKNGNSSGIAYAGLQYKPTKNMMMEGSYYNLQDMLNMAYVDLDYVYRLSGTNYVRLGTQYMYQGGNGDNLVTTGRDFNTGYWGVYLETRPFPWLIPYGMAGVTKSDDEIRAPYSIGPSYMVQRIGENSKAGEHTWILGALLDFSTFGARGLQFDANYGQRRDRHQWSATTVGAVTTYNYAETTDWDELATDLIYTFPGDTFFKGMRVRLRYARVWEDGGTLDGTKTTDDYRSDIGWNIPFN